MKKKWTSDEKKLIVLEMLQGKKSIAQICKEHCVNETMAYKWREKAIKALDTAFSSEGLPEDRFKSERID